MPKEIKPRDASCTGLFLSAPVQKIGETGNQFSIEAYTGEVVERWWGNLAIDVDGISAKKKIPILMNHDTSQIVGYSTDTYKNGSFFVTGKYSGVTEAAKEAKNLSEEGFPWQASIGVKPKKILSLEKDGTHQVNNRTITGPAEIWLESEVFETSFVPLGADSNTSVATFSKFEEKAQPSADNNNRKEILMEITLESLEKDAPELLKEVTSGAKAEGFAAGKADESARIISLAKSHFGDEIGEAFSALVSSGATVEQYKAFQKLNPAKKEPATDPGKDAKAVMLEAIKAAGATDPGQGTPDEGPKTFTEAWQGVKQELKCDTQRAMSTAAARYPELFKKHSGRA